MHLNYTAPHKLEGSLWKIFYHGGIVDELEGGEAIVNFPEDVGQENDEGDGASKP